MANPKRKTSQARSTVIPEPPAGLQGGQEATGDTTGRFLVLFREGANKAAIKALTSVAGLEAAVSVADLGEGEEPAQLAEAPFVVFETLGVGVVAGDPQQMGAAMMAAADDQSDIVAVEPERIMYALPDGVGADEPVGAGELSGPSGGFPPLGPPVAGGAIPLEYLRGYRDAVVALYELLASGGTAGSALEEAGIAAAFLDDAASTWGLKATKADGGRFDGRGVRVAVLDTGMDFNHPDSLGRLSIERARSFIPGESAQDGNGHGTHCIGTVSGPLRPGVGPRYGVAPRAEIFVGKVLSNAGSGADSSILAGIEWAITNGCQIISMSLGARVQPGESFSPIYENVARRALAAGSLIIAAAGNDSRRPGQISPVARPANCPSIMAVAALDNSLRVAPFSNGGINGVTSGGGVDIAGPGVQVLSSAPMPGRTRFLSGTSMATPHIAGLAALWAQARGVSGVALYQALMSTALRLRLSGRDVGAGLGQAPPMI